MTGMASPIVPVEDMMISSHAKAMTAPALIASGFT